MLPEDRFNPSGVELDGVRVLYRDRRRKPWQVIEGGALPTKGFRAHIFENDLDAVDTHNRNLHQSGENDIEPAGGCALLVEDFIFAKLAPLAKVCLIQYLADQGGVDSPGAQHPLRFTVGLFHDGKFAIQSGFRAHRDYPQARILRYTGALREQYKMPNLKRHEATPHLWGLCRMVVLPKSVSAESGSRPVVANARGLQPWLLEQAQRIETAKRIPEDVAERLASAGLFRMTQPPHFGGLGMTPGEAWEAVFEVAKGCGSCAWIVGLNTANILMIGKFSEAAQRDVFLSGKPAVVSMLTGGVAVGATVERVQGGVVLNGRWRYASGIDVASWAGLLVSLPAHNGEAQGPHVVLVPKEEFSIDDSTWNVLGMRGTGSKDIYLKNAFVPEHRWLSWTELQAGKKHPTCPNQEAIYEYPLNSVFAMSVLAPTLGVASAVAEEFVEVVKSRVSGATQLRQCEDKVAQIEVAMGEATMAMLRQNLLADSDLVIEIIHSGRLPTPRERAAIRMRIAVSARTALTAAQRMFAAMGGSILPMSTRVERLFRDLHAMSSHLLLQPDGIGEAYGRLLLGMELPPGARL